MCVASLPSSTEEEEEEEGDGRPSHGVDASSFVGEWFVGHDNGDENGERGVLMTDTDLPPHESSVSSLARHVRVGWRPHSAERASRVASTVVRFVGDSVPNVASSLLLDVTVVLDVLSKEALEVGFFSVLTEQTAEEGPTLRDVVRLTLDCYALAPRFFEELVTDRLVRLLSRVLFLPSDSFVRSAFLSADLLSTLSPHLTPTFVSNSERCSATIRVVLVLSAEVVTPVSSVQAFWSDLGSDLLVSLSKRVRTVDEGEIEEWTVTESCVVTRALSDLADVVVERGLGIDACPRLCDPIADAVAKDLETYSASVHHSYMGEGSGIPSRVFRVLEQQRWKFVLLRKARFVRSLCLLSLNAVFDVLYSVQDKRKLLDFLWYALLVDMDRSETPGFAPVVPPSLCFTIFKKRGWPFRERCLLLLRGGTFAQITSRFRQIAARVPPTTFPVDDELPPLLVSTWWKITERKDWREVHPSLTLAGAPSSGLRHDSVAFHVVDWLVGCDAVAKEERHPLNPCVRSFLKECVEGVLQKSRPSVATVDHCLHLVKRYSLGASLATRVGELWTPADHPLRNLLSSCSIQMTPLRLPVVAGDGYSYELESFLSYLSLTCKEDENEDVGGAPAVSGSERGVVSPFTRVSIVPFLLYDRHCLDSDARLCDFFSSIPVIYPRLSSSPLSPLPLDEAA